MQTLAVVVVLGSIVLDCFLQHDYDVEHPPQRLPAFLSGTLIKNTEVRFLLSAFGDAPTSRQVDPGIGLPLVLLSRRGTRSGISSSAVFVRVVRVVTWSHFIRLSVRQFNVLSSFEKDG